MRDTVLNHSGSPGIRAVDVWDVLVAAITQAGSIGEVLDDLTAAKIAFIDAAISGIPTTPFLAASLAYYTYSAPLGSTVKWIPAQKTIVMTAHIEGVNAAGEFDIMHGIADELSSNTWDDTLGKEGFTGAIMCDGTNVGFRNMTGAQNTISLYGVTIA